MKSSKEWRQKKIKINCIMIQLRLYLKHHLHFILKKIVMAILIARNFKAGGLDSETQLMTLYHAPMCMTVLEIYQAMKKSKRKTGQLVLISKENAKPHS